MKEQIRLYIQKNFLTKGRVLADNEALFETGVIDSLGHLKLISYLEKEFAISLSLDDLSWENFDSIDKIAALVDGRKAGG